MNIIQMNGYTYYAEGNTPNQLILTGKDIQGEIDSMKYYDVKAISINRRFCADRINNLDFLKHCDWIDSVQIVGDDFDCKGLYYLTGLKNLQDAEKSSIDYSKFHHLISLVTSRTKDLLLPESLQQLYLWNYKPSSHSLSEIIMPSTLKKLFLCKSNINNLSGLPTTIEKLEICLCRHFNSLESISIANDNLRSLVIENCPNLNNFQELSHCYQIEHLVLFNCGTIPDLSFIRNMKHLGHFAFPKTLVADGNLDLLEKVPSVYFTNNKRYNHKLKDFEK